MIRSRQVRIAVAVLLSLLYLRSPIDLIPDTAGPLGFLDDLIVFVLLMWWALRLPHPPAEGAAAGPSRERGEAPLEWDPHRVLGVAPGASREEVARAYRDQLKLYHPDRVADLCEELRELAHRKVIELRRAYEEIVER